MKNKRGQANALGSLARTGLRQHFGPRGIAKRTFETEPEAADYAVTAQANGGSKRRPYVAYHCDFCGRWHIGRKAA